MAAANPKLRRAAAGTALALGLALAAALTAPPAWTDDRDLLRENIAKPYVFILLDTSASMTLKVGSNQPTDLYGDDPESRLYAAKEALFQVFSQLENVHVGMGVFNQDFARATNKHWVYFTDQSLPPGWPIPWPRPDGNGKLTNPDPTNPATPIKDIDANADLQVVGRTLTNASGAPLPAGTCTAPLNLGVAADRKKINYYSKLGADGSATTQLWIKSGQATYQLRIRRAPASAVAPGQNDLPVKITVEEVAVCTGANSATFGDGPDPGMTATNETIDRTLRLDLRFNEFLFIDGTAAGGGVHTGTGETVDFPESVAGYWNWADGKGDNDCAQPSPHTGGGWESNYDSGTPVGDPVVDALITDDDAFCTNPADASTCVELRPLATTVPSTYGRSLDRGDVLPLDWRNDNKTEFLRRLAPNYPVGVPDFRVSPHLTNSPDPVTGLLRPSAGQPPIMASGVSPLGEAILDFRCYFQPRNSKKPDDFSNKCKKVNNQPFFGLGWEETACKYDALFSCRRPYLIVISDGENSCPGNSPTSEVASFRAKTGIETWALAVGTARCNNTELKFASGAGRGECLNVSTKGELVTELKRILGTITSQARTFASAAVPTVQTNANETLLLSSFQAIKNSGFWDGHLRNFRKPLPLDANGLPDINETCVDPAPPSPPDDGCVAWDAGKVLATTQAFDADPLDVDGPGKRRVFYGQRSVSGAWPGGRRLLDPTDPASGDPTRYDLWRGFSLIPEATPDSAFDDATETGIESVANDLVSDLLSLKSGTLNDNTPVPDYLLGDIFHSQPLIVEAPPNNFYFAQDAGADPAAPLAPCEIDDSGMGSNRGYRCFLQRHIYRRKLLLVGANDGMLHAFDVGRYDRSANEFTDGTGSEVWAYAPRAALPTLREVNQTGNHRFSVDGSPAVADVFIDPVFAGNPTAGQRQWRTVVVTGLREGGSSYFALDITQPEPLEDVPGLGFAPSEAAPATDAVAGCSDGGTDCGPNKYPAPLWEFFDSTADSFLTLPPPQPILMDEDQNGAPDLGDTWSNATIGRIRVCEGAECDPRQPVNNVRDLHVAVFGGGMDPINKDFDPRDAGMNVPPLRGNFLYMVDIETGRVVYKRALDGPTPGDAAAVDTDQDGYLDRIYIGTLFGSLYRVDLLPDVDNDYPKPSVTVVSDIEGNDYGAVRIMKDKNNQPTWEPVRIFDANWNGADPTDVPRAIYQAPSVFFVTQLGLYGVAFGTGDREDLMTWTPEGLGFQTGRFYVFVDDTGLDPAPALPLRETNFTGLDFDNTATLANLLSGGLGQKGWYLRLRGKEKVVSQAFSLLGLTFFSTFVSTPRELAPGEEDNTCPADPKDVNQGVTCNPTGNSRLFLTSTLQAQPFFTNEAGNPSRFIEVSGAFVSNPFTEIGITDDGSGAEGGAPAETLTDAEKDVMEAIKSLFPPNCRFTSQRVDVKLVTSDTAVQRIAAVPVCVIEKNWKEF